MVSATRKLIPAITSMFPTRLWGCNECTWQLPTPSRGPFGYTTSRAIMAQVRIGFGNHACASHQEAKS